MKASDAEKILEPVATKVRLGGKVLYKFHDGKVTDVR